MICGFKTYQPFSVLFQTIQFSITTQFCSIWPIDWTIWGANTRGLSGPWSGGNKCVLCTPQSSSINRTSPSDCLVSYLGHSFGKRVVPLCSVVVGVFYNPSPLGESLTDLNSELTLCEMHICPWFQIESSCPFSMTIAITLPTLSKKPKFTKLIIAAQYIWKKYFVSWNTRETKEEKAKMKIELICECRHVNEFFLCHLLFD